MKSQPLKPFENKYYMSLESDYTSHGGFQHRKELNEYTEAPDWNPSPHIDCGKGLHVVKGHPLFSHRFISRKAPIYFEVKTDPNPPIPSVNNDGKFRAQKVVKIRSVDENSHEFSLNVLADIAKNDEDYVVRQAAVERLDPKTNAELFADIAKSDENYFVRQAVVERLNPKTNAELFADIAKNDEDYVVRQAAVERLDPKTHAKLLADIAKSDENYFVRRAAVERLDPKTNAELFADIAKNDENYVVRQVAVERLKTLKKVGK